MIHIEGSVVGRHVRKVTPGLYLVRNTREISDRFGEADFSRRWEDGEIGLVPPGCSGEAVFEGGNVCLTQIIIPDRYLAIGTPFGTANWTVVRGKNDDAMRHMIMSVLQLGPKSDRISMGGVALGMVGRIRSWFEPSDDSIPSMAADYIHTHLEGSPTVKQVAEAMGLSQSHFIRTFKQSMGVTPAAYMAQVRFDRARYLIMNTELALPAIAVACAYSSQSHMTSDFNRRIGVTPGQLLKASRAKWPSTMTQTRN